MLQRLLLLAILSLPAVSPLAAADEDRADDDSVEHAVGSDHFAAGRAVSLAGAVTGDAFAAGGRITLDGSVAGDAFLAGAHVEVRGPVGQGLYAAGAFVIASGSVRHNARLVGGTVEVTPGAHFGGVLSMAGRTLSFAGATDGYLQMAGRDATVNGRVGGDLEVSAARIEIGPGARIAGKLRYRSDREPVVATGANTATWPEAAAPGASGWAVQAGAFASEPNAERLRTRLAARYPTPWVEDFHGLKRVKFGPYASRGEAEAANASLADLGLAGIVVAR